MTQCIGVHHTAKLTLSCSYFVVFSTLSDLRRVLYDKVLSTCHCSLLDVDVIFDAFEEECLRAG